MLLFAMQNSYQKRMLKVILSDALTVILIDYYHLFYNFVIVYHVAFHTSLYKNKTAVEQDDFIQMYIVPYEAERRRNHVPNRKLHTSIQYMVRQAEGGLIRVCAASFQSITGIGNDTCQQ